MRSKRFKILIRLYTKKFIYYFRVAKCMTNCIKCRKKLSVWQLFNSVDTKEGYICSPCYDKAKRIEEENKSKCGLCGKSFSLFYEGEPYKNKDDTNILVCKQCDAEQEHKRLVIKTKIEYKRKCKACGKAWHSLKVNELGICNDLKNQGFAGVASALGTLGGALSGSSQTWSAAGTSSQTTRNIHALQERLDKLRTCPKCGSHSYTEEEVSY